MCARKSCDDVNQKMFDFAVKAITVLHNKQKIVHNLIMQ